MENNEPKLAEDSLQIQHFDSQMQLQGFKLKFSEISHAIKDTQRLKVKCLSCKQVFICYVAEDNKIRICKTEDFINMYVLRAYAIFIKFLQVNSDLNLFHFFN